MRCTQSVAADRQAILDDLSLARASVPALAALLDAIGPLLAERARLREEAPGWTGPPPPLDPERYAAGASILSDSGFQDMSAQLPGALASLAPVLARCLPNLGPALEALGRALEDGTLAPEALAAAGFGEPLELPGIPPGQLGFIAAELVRPFVERQAMDLLDLVKELPWRHAHCPVCGDAPNMSVLRRVRDESEFIQAHGGRRFLRCGSCSAEWSHKRVSCPACGCEEPDELRVLRDPARPHERVDACLRCKSFVLCLDGGELARVPAAEVAALAMSPLEAKALEEGFVPLGRHPWTGLMSS